MFLEAVARRCSVKKVFLKILQHLRENTSARVSFLIKLQAEVCNFIKNETLAQVFSCECCEIFEGTFFYGTSPVAAFVCSCYSINTIYRYLIQPGEKHYFN